MRRVLTFTTAPLEADVEIAGPIELVLHAASTPQRHRFHRQAVGADARNRRTSAQRDVQPASRIVTKGWLRASMRATDPKLSRPHAPHYSFTTPAPLVPGRVYKFTIAVMPTAYRFRQGSRIRLELANGDSSVTEGVFAHPYTPDKVGRDTIHHDARRPSHILLPLVRR